MSAIQIITLGLLSSGAVLLGFVALMNLASCLPESMWPRTSGLMSWAVVGIGGPPFCLVLLNANIAALCVASVEGFIGGLISYFLGQRYESPVMKSNMVRGKPAFLPMAATVYFSFSASFLAIAGGWLWTVLPVLIWVVSGVACVELALRREQRRLATYGHDSSREMAVLVLNEYQGRGMPMSIFESRSKSNRYPFP